MVSLQQWLWLTLGGVLPLAVTVLMVYVKRRNARARTLRKVQQQFNGRSIWSMDSRSYFCGLKRKWDLQWRGYGVLILTRDRLYFRLWQRNLDLSIPRECLQAATVSFERGGKLLRRKHLQVIYRSADDQLRVATWFVQKPQVWVRQLQGTFKESFDGRKAQEEYLS